MELDHTSSLQWRTASELMRPMFSPSLYRKATAALSSAAACLTVLQSLSPNAHLLQRWELYFSCSTAICVCCYWITQRLDGGGEVAEAPAARPRPQHRLNCASESS